jgi:hypothetical protein
MMQCIIQLDKIATVLGKGDDWYVHFYRVVSQGHKPQYLPIVRSTGNATEFCERRF